MAIDKDKEIKSRINDKLSDLNSLLTEAAMNDIQVDIDFIDITSLGSVIEHKVFSANFKRIILI